ncbi:hypothetical protein evm_003991 [Chilo suppressalis]|nr:hypothetical protein evm_003991 [Chilo suppressalis]
MVKYIAYRCESAIYNRTPGLTFHQFPKDESTRNAWLLKYMKLQDWQPNTYSHGHHIRTIYSDRYFMKQ